MVLGEKNLSHLRRCGILEEDSTQRFRTGLISAAPPVLLRGDFGNDSVFLASASEGKPEKPLARRAGMKASATCRKEEEAKTTGGCATRPSS